jgi:hypothetical protein
MPTINLSFDVTTTQQEKLNRWFARWNPSNGNHASLEDGLKSILVSNVQNFIKDDNLLKIPLVTEALKTADEATQDQVLDLLGL